MSNPPPPARSLSPATSVAEDSEAGLPGRRGLANPTWVGYPTRFHFTSFLDAINN